MSVLRSARRSGLLARLIAVTATASALATAAPLATTAHAATLVTNPASLVNPFIGTSNSGDTFPGADSPFGMVQWSPDTTPSRPSGGGYASGSTAISGFSLTHISGPGCARTGVEGDIPVLPTVGAVDVTATDAFSHSNESASAGAYSVALGNGVTTKLTTTTHSGMAQFTFPASTQSNLVFKLTGSETPDSNVQFNTVSNTEVSGQVTTGNFCGMGTSYTVYFDMVFDRPFTSSGTASSDGYVTFDTTTTQQVQAKVGISYVSSANAAANRAAENPNWDFNATQSAAQAAWNSVLGRVRIAGGTADQQTVFYTALYHSLLHPNAISDVNGQYPGFDGTVHTVDAGHSAVYANYSGWDVYRSQAQLEALVAPQVASDTAQSMVDDYKQTGQFPKWSQNSGETYVMVGDPADAMLAEYYAFGARNFDTATALSGMVKEATVPGNNRPGLNYLESIGYLPSNGTYPNASKYFYYGGPASTTLEYNADDFAISALAGSLGDTADQTAFANRAQDWQNLLNHASGFIQPRDYSGSWTAGFSPTSGSNFTEGDSWQYTPMVPFNVQGLANAMGGNAKLATFLNNDLASFTGANGLANMGNEPSLVMPWEYDYIGQPYKTQQVERAVQDQLWTNSTSAAGNDDLGEMSSSYVWSALGMYPVTPGTADLALGSPLFTQAVITLPSGNTLTINGNGAADNAPYVQSAAWNGSSWNNAYLPGGAMSAGGTIDFNLGTTANTSWASGPSAAPPSYAGHQTYGSVGVSADGVANSASFDGKGDSYSATALSNAGLQPGSSVTANGASFTWPAAASGGQPDNYLANGQTLPVSGSGSISFLGSADYGPSSGNATVTYTDGTTESVPVTLSDWTLNGGTATLPSGERTAATTTYRNTSTGSQTSGNAYVFASAPINLMQGKTMASVTLPTNVATGGMHIFAVGFGPSTGTNQVSVTTPANQSTAVGAAASLSIVAADTASGQTLTYSATGLPAGLSINSATGVISGTPTTVGSSTVQVTATDGTGASGSASFAWNVGFTGAHTISLSGEGLDDPGFSTTSAKQMDTWLLNGGANQNWTFTPQSDGNYTLVNGASNQCLDASGASVTAGAAIIQYPCSGARNQEWTLTALSGGSYTIANANSGLLLTTASTSNGALVTQQANTNSSLQQWTIK